MYFYYYVPDELFYRNRPPIYPPPFPPNMPGNPMNPQSSKPNTPDSSPNQGPPMNPPPSFTPPKPSSKNNPGLKSIDSGAINFCRYKYTYIWLDNGKSFWTFITYVGKTSISGYRWTRFGWSYFGIDTRKIESFICY